MGIVSPPTQPMTERVPMTENLQLRLYTSPVGLYLTARGRLDATTTHRLVSAIGFALDRYPAGRLTLDLSDLDSIDSAAVATLIGLRATMRYQDVDLAIADPPSHIRAAIHALGAGHLLTADSPAD